MFDLSLFFQPLGPKQLISLTQRNSLPQSPGRAAFQGRSHPPRPRVGEKEPAHSWACVHQFGLALASLSVPVGSSPPILFGFFWPDLKIAGKTFSWCSVENLLFCMGFFAKKSSMQFRRNKSSMQFPAHRRSRPPGPYLPTWSPVLAKSRWQVPNCNPRMSEFRRAWMKHRLLRVHTAKCNVSPHLLPSLRDSRCPSSPSHPCSRRSPSSPTCWGVGQPAPSRARWPWRVRGICSVLALECLVGCVAQLVVGLHISWRGKFRA